MDGIDRRGILAGVLGLAASAAPLGRLAAQESSRFEPFMVRAKARELAARPFAAPSRTLPEGFADIGYDQYRNIRFERARTVFADTTSAFQAQWLPRGFLFKEQIDINLVKDGASRRIAPDNGNFRFDNGMQPPKNGQVLGYSGFRLMNPINAREIFDEIAVFQGASYFRALGRGNIYGSSARGLALNTADSRGEEFPLFREFWIEEPGPDAQAVVVHALLDSPSVAGAYRFTLRPGETTTTTVEMALYPRVAIDQVGIGALTSMFLFAPNDSGGHDDFRPAVHDAQGLAFISGAGERFWRPLTNPKRLEISVFADGGMRGFGLMQRQRAFFDYQDMEAQYEKRPSVWVEPLGEWGDGAVFLVEIPVQEEIHDNIVALWRPKAPLAKGGEYLFTYRLHWGMNGPDAAALARVACTRTGAAGKGRLFVIDYAGGDLDGAGTQALSALVTNGGGKIENVVVQPNPHIKGARLSFNLLPEGAQSIELRARLMRGEAPAAETWLYRWTAP